MNNNVTVRQLRAFLMVTQERSFTKAAQRLNVTQSALTAAIKGLESELGLKLFDRTTRVVEPTIYGERFASVAERLLEDLSRSVDDLRASAARQHGLVVIGATATTISYLLVPALTELAARYPGIRVRLTEELAEGAIQRVRNGDIDLALTTVERAETDIDAIPILRDHFELVCAPDHPLAERKDELSWSVFENHDRVGLSWQSGIRGLVDREENARIAVQDLRYEVSSVAGLKSMIASNLGIAAVPGLIAREMSDFGIVRHRLRPKLSRTVSIALRPGRSPTPAASAVVAAALRRLDQIREPDITPVADVDALEGRGFSIREDE